MFSVHITGRVGPLHRQHLVSQTGTPGTAIPSPGPLDEHRSRIEEQVGRSMRHLSAARCSALLFATFDADGDAMDDGDRVEAANRAYFRNFLSGMS